MRDLERLLQGGALEYRPCFMGTGFGDVIGFITGVLLIQKIQGYRIDTQIVVWATCMGTGFIVHLCYYCYGAESILCYSHLVSDVGCFFEIVCYGVSK